MELSESLAETLPALQRVFSTLHDREAMSLGIPTAEVSCIVDFSVVKGMRIEAGHIPIIRISAVWAYECVLYQKTDLLVRALRRAIVVAHTKLRWTLNGRKTRFAAEYIEKARTFRLTNAETFSLPIKNFRTRLTVSMCDPMTGESETREGVRPEELEYVETEMAHLLTAKVYAHEQAAKLLDTLHAHKLAMTEPAEVSAMDILQVSSDHVIETMEYQDPIVSTEDSNGE
jgi:hypothetical protein